MQKLAEYLKEAIRAEKIAGEFYRYISEKVENGYIRKSFKKFSEDEAGKHKLLLQNRLKELSGEVYEPDVDQDKATMVASKFSLATVSKIAMDAEEKAVAFYAMAKDEDAPEYTQMYEDIMRDEKQHGAYLSQEGLFAQERQEFSDSWGMKLFALFQTA